MELQRAELNQPQTTPLDPLVVKAALHVIDDVLHDSSFALRAFRYGPETVQVELEQWPKYKCSSVNVLTTEPLHSALIQLARKIVKGRG